MPLYTRPDGSDGFETHPGIDNDLGVSLDTIINGLVAIVNALDNANIASSPQIAGSKVDLSSAGYLPLTGGSLSALLTHNFDGVFRLMRASGNGRIREYRGSDGAIWGISYNTYWTGSAWNGRDITDICAVLKMESDGLHYYHAVSGSAGSTPSFTEIFHVDTSGVFQVTDCVQTSNLQADSITQAKIDWANAGGLQQGLILDTELTHTGDTNWTELSVDHIQIYIPSNATSLEYTARIKSTSAINASCRLACGATDGSAIATTSTSYIWVGTGTLDISALSGWQSIDIDLKIDDGAHTASVDRIVYRII